MSSQSSTSSSWALPPAPIHPKTTDPGFIGYVFKNDHHRWRIHEKTANKRGSTSLDLASWCPSFGRQVVLIRRRHIGCVIAAGITTRRKVVYTSSTTPAIDYMKDVHYWNSDGPIVDVAGESIADQLTAQAPSVDANDQTTSSLITKTRVKLFRKLLLQFVCTGRLPLSCVESEQFQALIRELNPGMYDYMWKSGNTVKVMLLGEFDRGKEALKLAFKNALSKVHISFDLWMSPNKLAMLGVVAHYLAPDLTAKSPLIALRKLSGNHSGENQGKILLEVAEEFDLSKEKAGIFHF